MLKKFSSIRGRILIGLVLFFVSAIIFQYNSNFRAEAIKTQGTIIDIITSSNSDDASLNYYPVLEYIANDGKAYTYKPSISRNKEPKIGDTETIYYNPKNPGKALSGDTSFNLFVILPLIIGVILILSVAGNLIIGYFKRYRTIRLKSTGRHLEIPIHLVFVTVSTKDGKDCYHINCQWYNKQRHEVHMFKSEDFKEHPERWLIRQSVSVYIAPNNPSNYIVDTDFITDKHA